MKKKKIEKINSTSQGLKKSVKEGQKFPPSSTALGFTSWYDTDHMIDNGKDIVGGLLRR